MQSRNALIDLMFRQQLGDAVNQVMRGETPGSWITNLPTPKGTERLLEYSGAGTVGPSSVYQEGLGFNNIEAPIMGPNMNQMQQYNNSDMDNELMEYFGGFGS